MSLMPIVVVGHVDHGKSTVVGRLLAETVGAAAADLSVPEGATLHEACAAMTDLLTARGVLPS